MIELTRGQFESVRPLFEGFDYSLSIIAAIEGNNPGRIFVDDESAPSAALALTVEGYLLAGECNNPTTIALLERLFREEIFPGRIFVNGAKSVSLAVFPDAWEARLPEIIPTHEAEKIKRYHYLCQRLSIDWRDTIPEGYTVHRIDRALLNESQIVFPGEIAGWMDIAEMWGTEENFLSKGVSFCAVQGNEVVCWCVPDCVAGDRIDVGILTHPDHRRLGLATAVVAAAVEYCLSHGFRTVGWHCNTENRASWKTAEKVGFKRQREYFYYYYMCNPIDHLAELGWYHYRAGDYRKTVNYYDQVFSQRIDNPDYYYHLAASAWALLGDKEKALIHLQAAVEHGWDDYSFTSEQDEFQQLHDDPRWGLLLMSMKQNNNVKQKNKTTKAIIDYSFLFPPSA